MRVGDLPLWASGCALLCLALACHAGEPAASEASAPAAGAKPSAKPNAEASAEARAQPADPERAAKLRDLDELCAAVDHDYKDGTLGDYYAEVSPRTDWGKAQRDAGNESIQPGRLLEKAVAELDPSGEDPGLPSCRTLLDYIDDVE